MKTCSEVFKVTCNLFNISILIDILIIDRFGASRRLLPVNLDH